MLMHHLVLAALEVEDTMEIMVQLDNNLLNQEILVHTDMGIPAVPAQEVHITHQVAEEELVMLLLLMLHLLMLEFQEVKVEFQIHLVHQ